MQFRLPPIELPPLFHSRVSREELALSRRVWVSSAAVFTMFAVTLVVLAIHPFGLQIDRLSVSLMAVLLTAFSVTIVRSEPGAVGSLRNHVFLAALYSCVALAVVALRPSAVAAIAATVFIAPATAMRITNRTHLAAHYSAASALLLLPSLLGIVDQATTITTLFVIPSIWVLGFVSTILFEGIERQGDELEALVRRDPLTGIGNLRSLTEHLHDQVTRHSRARRPLSVLRLDLNAFGEINRELGYNGGDAVLVQVAATLRRTARSGDLVARISGNEFCIVLGDTSSLEAVTFANEVTAALAAIDDPVQGLSASIGIATFPDDAHEQALLRIAAERMLDDKLTGHALPSVTAPRSPMPRLGDARPAPVAARMTRSELVVDRRV